MSQAGANNASGTPGITEYIEGNTGGPVPPDGSNIIYLLGSGDILVAGDPGTNTLTISASGLSQWSTISASQALATNNGYICVGGAVLSLSLPTTSNLGDTIEITLDGSTGWTITQDGSQQIRVGSAQTTFGATGTLSSIMQGDTVRMVCSVANAKWNVLSSMGNLGVV